MFNVFQGFGNFGNFGGLVQGGQGQSFRRTFSARSATLFHSYRAEMDGGKILLPPSALEELTMYHVEYPMLFEIKNSNTGAKTHCGVLEFTAEEGVCYAPRWIMEQLLLQEGSYVDVRNVSLPRGRMVTLQPHRTEFIELADPKVVLEVALRNFNTLTVGDAIAIIYNNDRYYINVCKVEPDTYAAISITETDLKLDFEEPLDYQQRRAEKSGANVNSGGGDVRTDGAGAAGGGDGGGAATSTRSGAGQTLGGTARAPKRKRVHKNRVKYIIRGGQILKQTVDSDSESTDEEEMEAAANAAAGADGGGEEVQKPIAFQGKGNVLRQRKKKR